MNLHFQPFSHPRFQGTPGLDQPTGAISGKPAPEKPVDIVALGAVVCDIIGSVSPKSISYLPDGQPDMANILGRKLKASGPIVPNVGGGAANVARNFLKQGLKSAVLGRISNDFFGRWLQDQLPRFGIDLSLLQVHQIPEDAPTDYPLTTGVSQVISIEGFDRTINTWKGSGDDLRLNEVDWTRLLNAKGLYISNFSSKQDPDFLEVMVTKARKNNLTVAFNPGKSQISEGLEKLTPVLQNVDILSVNLGEAQELSGLPPESTLEERLKKLKSAGPRIVIITDGKNGAFACDGTHQYHAPVFRAEVKSTLGAGDAFCSTFMAAYMENPTDIGRALLRASANSASVVSHVGAQKGLMAPTEIDAFIATQPDIQVEKTPLGE